MQQNALQDQNRFNTLIVQQGSTGTANTGTETMRVGGDPTTGAMYTNVSGGAVGIQPMNGVILSTQTVVGTIATLLPGTPLANRKAIIVYNEGANTIYIGGSTVTVAGGFPVWSTDYSPPMDAGSANLYAISSSASGTIRILEIS